MNSPPSLQLPLNAILSIMCPENEYCTQRFPLPSPLPNKSSRLDIKQIPNFTMDSQLNITGNIFAVILQMWYVSQCCGGTAKRKDENSMACHHFHNFIEKIFPKYKTEWEGVLGIQGVFLFSIYSLNRAEWQETLMDELLNYTEILQWFKVAL